jgi:UDP-glucose 4-epimerase
MNILVAGGAGFIGGHLTDVLMQEEHFVACADNLCLGSANTLSRHFGNTLFRFYEMDLCDEANLKAIFARHSFERVYHLAANSDIQKSGEDPSIDLHNTFFTTVGILNAMREYGVKELMFASTSAVYGDKRGILKEDTGDLRPISYYGGAKLASEAFISSFAAMNGFKANIIRFPNVVGPRLTHGVIHDFIAKLCKNRASLEILGDGRQEKPYIYVADLIEAIMALRYETGVQVYNVGVESATTVRRIADIVCEEMGLRDVEYRFTGGSVGWLGDVPKFQYDLSKIRLLGWRAKHTSDEAVRLAARNAS